MTLVHSQNKACPDRIKSRSLITELTNISAISVSIGILQCFIFFENNKILIVNNYSQYIYFKNYNCYIIKENSCSDYNIIIRNLSITYFSSYYLSLMLDIIYFIIFNYHIYLINVFKMKFPTMITPLITAKVTIIL